MCEVSLHNAGLYSTTLLQLSGLTATYMAYRMQLVGKVSHGAAIMATTIHVGKALAGATAMVLDGNGGGEVTLYSLVALCCITYAVASVFVFRSNNQTQLPSLQVSNNKLRICMVLCMHYLSANI